MATPVILFSNLVKKCCNYYYYKLVSCSKCFAFFSCLFFFSLSLFFFYFPGGVCQVAQTPFSSSSSPFNVHLSSSHKLTHFFPLFSSSPPPPPSPLPYPLPFFKASFPLSTLFFCCSQASRSMERAQIVFFCQRIPTIVQSGKKHIKREVNSWLGCQV